MSTSEKFCLKWKDFKDNTNTAFVSLRKDTDFTDVTLTCEDGHQIDAHKVILASSSPFFLNMLTRNRHAHPLIYMRGVKSEDLEAIFDFLYYGEANIYQDNLNTFLNIAEGLQLKGLNIEKGCDERVEDNPLNQNVNVLTDSQHIKQDTIPVAQNNSVDSKSFSKSSELAVAKEEFSGDLQGLDEKIETMMGRGENMVKSGSRLKNGEWRMGKAYICQVCGKEGKMTNIKTHIEAHHLNGIIIPCQTFRSRDSLRHHNYLRHTNVNSLLF